VRLVRTSPNLLEEKVRSAKFACWVPSQGRLPGHDGKDEHGQQCESQRRGRYGISIAPHAYKEHRNGSSTQRDDQGEQEAHAARFMRSISFFLRGSTMRVCHRNTFCRCEPSSLSEGALTARSSA
jgi:hypothetical protein